MREKGNSVQSDCKEDLAESEREIVPEILAGRPTTKSITTQAQGWEGIWRSPTGADVPLLPRAFDCSHKRE